MQNGDATIKKPKDHWEQACDFFETMLDDFRSKNLLRRNIDKSERERLNLIWENSRNYETTLSDMFNRFKSVGEPTPEDIAKKCAEVGLTKDTLNYLFLSQLIGTFLIELESLFRTSLIFFLEETRGIQKNMDLRKLLKAIKKISPSIEKELHSLIDIDLRNTLAHGVFWFKKGTLFLAKNSYLKKVEPLALGRLYVRIIGMMIVSDALVHTLKQKEEQGYFKS